jgi:hypothetical protein
MVKDDFESPILLEAGAEPEIFSEYLPEPGFFLFARRITTASPVLRAARARNRTVLEISLDPPESASDHRIRTNTLSEALTMNIREILLEHDVLKERLTKNGKDGLYNLCRECACKTDDLAPCGDITLDCMAGNFVYKGDLGEDCGSQWRQGGQRGNDFWIGEDHLGPEAPKCALPNGTYRTKRGSSVTVSGQHGGVSRIDFEWIEEDNSCIECEPAIADGYLVWHCDEHDGGAVLYEDKKDA